MASFPVLSTVYVQKYFGFNRVAPPKTDTPDAFILPLSKFTVPVSLKVVQTPVAFFQLNLRKNKYNHLSDSQEPNGGIPIIGLVH